MADTHLIAEGWGIRPILFYIGGFGMPSYAFFMLLALCVSIVVYCYEARRSRTVSENTFYIFMAALVGGVFGAKIPFWIIHARQIIAGFPDIRPLLSGRTIVGAMIGGAIGVRLIKKRLGIKERKGNLFAPAVAAGIAVGRVGCFLRGCCYGIATGLPWGVDFGDGIMRHPTQLYEAAFAVAMFFFLQYAKRRLKQPGILFKIFMAAYFSFRFLVEFIRASDKIVWGLSMFQLVSAVVLVYYVSILVGIWIKKEEAGSHG